MRKVINIGGIDVAFKASASTTIKFRNKFGKDMIKEMTKIYAEYNNGSMIAYSAETLEMFFDLAYIMAKQANPSITDDPDEWLDEFDVFPIDVVFPQIMELWQNSLQTVDVAKKA